MTGLSCLILVVLVAGVFTAKSAAVMSDPSETYLDSDKQVHLIWRFNETHLEVQLTARTLGWMAFGITPDGGMDQTDAFLAYVNDTTGAVFLEDRWLTFNSSTHVTLMAKDPVQDWTLLAGGQTTTETTVRAVRALVTCDTKMDRPFTRNTLKIIWSWHRMDPSDLVKLPHHTQRGVKSMLLFSPAYLRVTPPSSLTLRQDMAVTMDRAVVPNDTITSNQCRLLQLPKLPTKLHVTKTRPAIQPGNEASVQMILVYLCKTSVDGAVPPLQMTFDCENPSYPSMVAARQSCTSLIATWTFGSEEFSYPDEIGMPLNVENSEKYIMLRVQYDNSQKLGVNDSSGIILTTTDVLRRYDAGFLSTGLQQYDYQLTIPPNVDSFLFQSHCMDFCTQSSFPTTGINVFAVLPLQQRQGSKIVVRHIRNGKELSEIISDDSTDSNYQRVHYPVSLTTIFPGDRLIVECLFSTKGKSTITFGGHGENDETCQAILSYYPAINTTTCGSMINTKRFLEATEYSPASPSKQSTLSEEDISNTTNIRNYLASKRTWNAANVAKLQQFYKDEDQLGICLGTGADSLKSIHNAPYIAAPAKPDFCIGKASIDLPPPVVLTTVVGGAGNTAGDADKTGKGLVILKPTSLKPGGTPSQAPPQSGSNGSVSVQNSIIFLLFSHLLIAFNLVSLI